MAPGVMPVVHTAAAGAAVLIAGVAVFQAALALRLPLGDATLGGLVVPLLTGVVAFGAPG